MTLHFWCIVLGKGLGHLTLKIPKVSEYPSIAHALRVNLILFVQVVICASREELWVSFMFRLVLGLAFVLMLWLVL